MGWRFINYLSYGLVTNARDRMPHGRGIRAYMDVFTARLGQLLPVHGLNRVNINLLRCGNSCSFVLLILFISLLTACGFHLRGQIELPEQLSPLYLEAENLNSDLLRELNNLFRANNIIIAESRSSASAFLEIMQVNKTRRVLSVDNRGRVREYELSLRIQYRLRGKNISEKNVSGISKIINLKRDLLFDSDSVLAISYEQEVLYQDMSRDAARLILQQLTAVGKKL